MTYCVSTITYAELLLGAERSSNTRKHHRLISAICERLDVILPWDSAAAESFARLQAALFSVGTPIGNDDTMFADRALSVGATIVTNNQKHFAKVKKLKTENWI